MKFRYILREYKIGKTCWFGIGLVDAQSEELLCSYSCVSTSREAVEHLIETCNRLKLSPCHLVDVIHDFQAYEVVQEEDEETIPIF